MKSGEKKQLYIALAIILLTGLFLVQYVPTVKKARAYETANLELVAANAESAARFQGLPTLYEDINRLRGQVKDYDAKVPQGRFQGVFLEKLATVMQGYGLGKLVIQPGTESVKNKLGCIPVTISCNGKTEQIFNFLKSMEKFKRIINIERADFKNDKNFDGRVSMRIEAKIFYVKK